MGFFRIKVVLVMLLVVWTIITFHEISEAQDFSGFESTEPWVEYDLGTLTVDSDDYFLKIINLPDTRFSNDIFFTLFFWKEDHEIGKINFIRRNEQLQFQGILIHEEWRGQHLSKPFLKAFCQLALITCHGITTYSKQRKPLVNLQLQKIGLVAESSRHICHIDANRYEDGALHVYARTSNFSPTLIASQKLHIMNHPPTKSALVAVFTHFSQPIEIENFEKNLMLIPGSPKFTKSVKGSL